MPCCLYDLSHSLVLQRRRGRSARELAGVRVTALRVQTLYRPRMRCRAVNVRRAVRLVEQDEVLLGSLVGVRLLVELRGWCRQGG